MWYVYILKCEDGSFYTGVSTDISRRFNEHAKKIGGKYTRSHAVNDIIYTEKALSQSDALKREAQIKEWCREKKINLIQFGKPIV
jgi:putative endonuclease